MSPVLDGRFRLGRLLGRGGMAEVWQATDLRTGEEVAIKRPVLTSEAELLMAGGHPNLPRGIAAGGDQVAMELLPGRLAEGECMPVHRACEVLLDVLAALSHLHARGLVHRDVKPSNIRLRADGTAVLCDLGLACPIGATDRPLGSPVYIAPEQLVDGAIVDGRADLFAAATTLFVLVTGAVPSPWRWPFAPDREELMRASLPAHGISRCLDGALQQVPCDRPCISSFMRTLSEYRRAG